MRRCSTLLLLLTAATLHAQDLTGIWQGHFSSADELRSVPDGDRYKFEVQIAQHNKTFEAVTYSYLSSVFYGKADAKGTVNIKTGKVILQEGRLLEVRMALGSGACTMTCFLQYSKSGDEEFLEGSFGSMNIRDSSNCGKGTVFLRKVAASDFYKEPFVAKREKEIAEEKKALAKNTHPVHGSGGSNHINHTDSLRRSTASRAKTTASSTNPSTAALTQKHTNTTPTHHNPAVRKPGAPTPSKVDIAKVSRSDTPSINTIASAPGTVSPLVLPEVLRDRSNELVKTITVSTNEVTLNIYDDGAIDNDTISVFLDNKAVISHAMLTDKAIVVTLHLDETHNTHEIVMVADNEGLIPPNTSLMVVKAGDQEYDVRIASTEQKNAVVVFKYEKAK